MQKTGYGNASPPSIACRIASTHGDGQLNNLHIDFAPSTCKKAILLTPLSSWLLLLGAAALWIYIAIAAIALFHQREINNIALKQFVQKSMGPNSGAPQATDALDLPESQVNVINGVIAQLNLPWRDLLDTLEVATPATIALLSIEPDSKKRTLRGLAEAKTSDDMLDYIGRLNEKPFFLNVRLTKHEINEQDPNRPLRFQFEAQWTEP